MTRTLVAVLALAGLAACTTTGIEQCQRSAYKRVQDLERRIQVTEQNIERGYAVHRWTSTSPRVGMCTQNGPMRVCTGSGGPRRQEQPVAIDVNQQREVLAQLRTQLVAARQQAAASAQACAARAG